MLFRSALLPILFASTGCTSLIKTLVVLLHDPRLPAEYDLKGKRVAVITTCDGISTEDASALVMQNQFKMFLKKELNSKIDFINQQEVNRAFNDQPRERVNYAELANQIEAEHVVVIDIKNLKLKQGKTLYQGNCDCSVAVFVPEEGKKAVFTKDLGNFIHPSGGKPSTECTEAEFQRHYLGLLARQAARLFYKWDPSEDTALDAVAI